MEQGSKGYERVRAGRRERVKRKESVLREKERVMLSHLTLRRKSRLGFDANELNREPSG